MNSTTVVYVQVNDVQNTPPMFTGFLSAEVSEDAPINTVVLTVHAEDGDRGMPRKIVYELMKGITNNRNFLGHFNIFCLRSHELFFARFRNRRDSHSQTFG